MNNCYLLVILWLLLSSVIAQAGSSPTGFQDKPISRQFTDDELQAWKEISSRAGRFSVMMPGQPEETLQAFENKNPAFLTKLKTSVAMYGVWYRDYPNPLTDPERIRFALKFARDYALSGLKSKLLAESETKLDDIIGLGSTIELKEGLIWKTRNYLLGRRFYQVSIWVSARDYPKRRDYYDHLADKFFSSFKIMRGAVA